MKPRVTAIARHRCPTCGAAFKQGKFALAWSHRRADRGDPHAPPPPVTYCGTCPGCGASADRMRRSAKE